MKENKIDFRTCGRVALVIVAIIFAYLFLLNGRYADIDANSCFDKWTGKRILVEWSDE